MKKKPKKKKVQKKTKVLKPSKYWGFEKGALPKYSRNLVDHDYLDKLSEEEKAWLNEFDEEYYANTFRKDGKRTLKSGKKKTIRKGLHQSAGVDRKELYQATNARYRDIYNQRLRSDVEDTSDDVEEGYESFEDAVIDKIDMERAGLDWTEQFGEDEE